MRLWSIHPSYLDRQGLLAVWAEGLLALKVLQDKTKGYKNHPQLERFNIQTIQQYLHYICDEGLKRGYKFNRDKISEKRRINYKLSVSNKQLEYEIWHLQKKLQKRDLEQFVANLYTIFNSDMTIKELKPHPLFKIAKGDIETWEKIKD